MGLHYVLHVGTNFFLASQSSVGRVDRQEYLAQHLDPERPSFDYVNAAAYGVLPSRRDLRSSITRRRQAGSLTSAISPAREIRDIRINVEHSEWLIDNEHFLAFTEDYQSDSDQKVIAFGTLSFIKLLFDAETITADGTFKVVPVPYKGKKGQLLVLQALHRNVLVPCVYILLPGKTTGLYTRVMALLLRIAVDNSWFISWTRVICDFEKALRSAITDAVDASSLYFLKFTEFKVQGCWFHFTQAVMKHVKGDPQLRVLYTCHEFSIFRLYVRWLMALGFLEWNRVEDVFLHLNGSHSI